MARIDYYDIQDTIRSILDADATLDGVTVTVEEEVLFSAEQAPWVSIYLDRRDPTAGQPLAAGTRTRYRVQFSIWCWEYSLDSLKTAMELRDDLVGKVELVLMGNRSLSGKVGGLMLDGGAFMTAKDQGSWVTGAEILVSCDATAIT